MRFSASTASSPEGRRGRLPARTPAARTPVARTLGVVGFVLSLIGAIAAINADLGPSWYPIALALTALPCAWLGGVMHRASASEAQA